MKICLQELLYLSLYIVVTAKWLWTFMLGQRYLVCDSVVANLFLCTLSEEYSTKFTWLLTAFIYVTPYENLMNEVLDDILFLGGDLQRVHTRYVEVVDHNISAIIENATRVKDFIENIEFDKIWNWIYWNYVYHNWCWLSRSCAHIYNIHNNYWI